MRKKSRRTKVGHSWVVIVHDGRCKSSRYGLGGDMGAGTTGDFTGSSVTSASEDRGRDDTRGSRPESTEEISTDSVEKECSLLLSLSSHCPFVSDVVSEGRVRRE